MLHIRLEAILIRDPSKDRRVSPTSPGIGTPNFPSSDGQEMSHVKDTALKPVGHSATRFSMQTLCWAASFPPT